jgi:hypothetical protein
MTRVMFEWRGEVSRTLLVGSRSSGAVGQRGRGQASFAQHLRSGIVKGFEVQHLTLVRLPSFSLPRDLVPDLVERVGALSEDHSLTVCPLASRTMMALRPERGRHYACLRTRGDTERTTECCGSPWHVLPKLFLTSMLSMRTKYLDAV